LLGTPGQFEEGFPEALPITLIHGVYDDVPVIYTELANCPDWLSLMIIIRRRTLSARRRRNPPLQNDGSICIVGAEAAGWRRGHG
jgi:trehalose/maltose hydrolase-like predicted phosphorylase